MSFEHGNASGGDCGVLCVVPAGKDPNMTERRDPPRIDIAPNAKRVRVTWRGRTVADSRRALKLTEGLHPPVLYIPREDADMALMQRTSHETRCPWKGTASYYSLHTEDATSENAVWTYEAPIASVAEIKNHLAFYGSRVDAIEELETS
jgi:uncharacterized protein (DUF427 family)